MPCLLVNMTAEKFEISIFCFLKSFADMGSSKMKGWKDNSTPYFLASSKYGDLSVSGLGWVIKILFTVLTDIVEISVFTLSLPMHLTNGIAKLISFFQI